MTLLALSLAAVLSQTPSPESEALNTLVKFQKHEVSLSKEQVGAALKVVLNAIQNTNTSESFIQRARAVALENTAGFLIGSKSPAVESQPFTQIRAILELRELQVRAVDDQPTHPSVVNFPGVVSTTAERVTEKVLVDTRVPNWHSTGLYAAPGEVITLNVPAAVVGKKFTFRIGCHIDDIQGIDRWTRFPGDLTKTVEITKSSTRLACAFGGPVYVEVPENSKLGTVPFSIQGAVKAPIYVKGRTSLAQWKVIRNAPGPWAEIGSDKLVLSVPSKLVRNLDNPDKLMDFWDEMMDHQADLYAISRTRRYPERFVMDEEISAGYMHSGYPIMMHLDVEQNIVDVKKLREPKAAVWGYYHEMGHNHQDLDQGAWTFDGCGEVTNNLASLYCQEKLNHDPGHPAIAERKKNIQKYMAAGAKFEAWKDDPFLALSMFQQLQEAFGWDAFKKFFKGYHETKAADLPKTDDEKRDQWMIRFSKQVHRNLGPFFQTWGVPTSDAARKSIAGLPVWMPEDLKPRN